MKFTISLLAFVFMAGLFNAKAQTTLSDPEVAAVAVAANQIDIKYGEIPMSWKYFPQINATTSTDPDGWVKSFRWTKVSGPSSYYIVAPNSGLTKVTGLVAGTYVFRVTVTDNENKTSTDDVTITMTNN